MGLINLKRLAIGSKRLFKMSPSKRFNGSSTTTFSLYQAIVNQDNGGKIAVTDQFGNLTYDQLKTNSDLISGAIRRELGENARISLLCGNNSRYIQAMLAIWKSGNVAVPLCQSHPPESLKYYVTDSESSSVIVENQKFKDIVQTFLETAGKKVFLLDDLLATGVTTNNEHESQEDAMLLYTSGTTGSPKGVVITADNIKSQIQNMMTVWQWSQHDTILHTLPLHHVHGVVNCLLTPLNAGAKVVMEPKFDADKVWASLLDNPDVNVYMAVPTIYVKLIQKHESFNDKKKDLIKQKLMEKMRLMVSGSAALPTPILHKWHSISGHTLLERYGMTEIGMALTNPYDQNQRLAGYVGIPFPNVTARIVKQGSENQVLVEGGYDGSQVMAKGDLSGDLQIKGPSVFRCYYNRAEATKKEFTEDGWFKTGDTAQYDPEARAYKILGRTSVDIIKSGGYKIGALNIERVLLEHPSITDVAVCGVPDETWGQRVGAVIVASEALQLKSLNEWAKEKLPKYCLPTLLKQMDELPKNAMGKVNKKELVKIAFPV